MTSYLEQHPGGEAMLRRGGKDVTFVLPRVGPHRFSMNFIRKTLDECSIGKVEK